MVYVWLTIIMSKVRAAGPPPKIILTSLKVFLLAGWRNSQTKVCDSPCMLVCSVFNAGRAITSSHEVSRLIRKHRACWLKGWFSSNTGASAGSSVRGNLVSSFPLAALSSYTSSTELGSPCMGGSTGSIQPSTEKTGIFIENAASLFLLPKTECKNYTPCGRTCWDCIKLKWMGDDKTAAQTFSSGWLFVDQISTFFNILTD